MLNGSRAPEDRRGREAAGGRGRTVNAVGMAGFKVEAILSRMRYEENVFIAESASASPPRDFLVRLRPT